MYFIKLFSNGKLIIISILARLKHNRFSVIVSIWPNVNINNYSAFKTLTLNMQL